VLIRGYMATSLDGYIADKDGGVGWLDAFQGVEVGEAAFMAGIGTVIVGRTTFDQMLGFPGGWAFPGKHGIVVTSHAIADPPDGVEIWSQGVKSLIARLRADPDANAGWVVGGASLQAAFIAAGAIDTLDVFVIPVLLGDGVRMFPEGMPQRRLALTSAEALGLGMVRLSYRIPAGKTAN